MKNFVLIDHEPWTLRRKQLFYDLFKNAGLELTVLDLSQWLYNGLHNPDELLDVPYLTKIHNKQEFEVALSQLNPNQTIIVEEVFRIWQNRHVFNILAQRGFDCIKIELFGNTGLEESLFERLKSLKISQVFPIIKTKIETLKFQLYMKRKHIKPISNILSSNIFNRTIEFNHPDYDDYKFSEHQKLVEPPYIVFCDNYFPFHTDLKFFFNNKNLPDGKKYQATMKSYFDFLESKYKMPVVIAAHPKSAYKDGTFGKRPIIKYHTDDLIFYSSMVTLHMCNTISYVLLGDKPLAFIATDEYLRFPDSMKRRFYNLAVNKLGLNIYNLDKTNFEKIIFKKINSDLRKNYIYNYLTSIQTENRPNYVSLNNFAKSLNPT